jgi:hypothetical protein
MTKDSVESFKTKDLVLNESLESGIIKGSFFFFSAIEKFFLSLAKNNF